MKAPAPRPAPSSMRAVVDEISHLIAPRLAHVAQMMAHDVHVSGVRHHHSTRDHILERITMLGPVLDPLLAGRASREQDGEPQPPFALTLNGTRMVEGMLKPFFERACPLIDGDPTSRIVSDALDMPTPYRDHYLEGVLCLDDGVHIPWKAPAPIAFDVIACRRSVTPKQALSLARSAVRAMRPVPLRRKRS